MSPGTFVRLPDGREGTVVYHGLDGYGIVWGGRGVDAKTILAACPVVGPEPEGYPEDLMPEAMLREPWPGAELPCIGSDYKRIETEETR